MQSVGGGLRKSCLTERSAPRVPLDRDITNKWSDPMICGLAPWGAVRTQTVASMVYVQTTPVIFSVNCYEGNFQALDGVGIIMNR